MAGYHNLQRLLSPDDSLYDCPIMDNFGPNSPPPPYEPTGYDRARMDEEMTEVHYDTAEQSRRAIVHIKDANDITGTGMTFSLGLNKTLKNILDSFKAKSCANCKRPYDMRFKTNNGKRVNENDTPAQLNIMHMHTLSIRVFSGNPGLKCFSCKQSGYPSSNGKQLDGDYPMQPDTPAPRNQLIRLLFEDPNGRIIGIPVQSTYQMRHAMSDYAGRSECSLGTLKFQFENEWLCEEDVPTELGLYSNALIKVLMHAMGA